MDFVTMRAVKRYLEAAPPSVTLYDIRLTPTESHVHPVDVDLQTKVGHAKLNIIALSSAMDTVTSARLAQELSSLGGAGILYRHKDAATQLEWAKQVIAHRWCMVEKPASLRENHTIADAKHILDSKGFSTIPVVDDHERLLSILFTKDVAFHRHLGDPVSKWAKPFERLKTVDVGTSFREIRERLLSEQECSVLPVVDDQRRLHGIYFMKDVIHANPSVYGGRPLVGIAIGVREEDEERALEAVRAGVGIIDIQSSHGDSGDVLRQTERVATLVAPFGDITVIAGNIADVDGGGYARLASAGANAVRVGIGSGSICTTTEGTGAGVGMVTAIRACVERARRRPEPGKAWPSIIADGGINGSGDAVKALLVGAHAVIGGKWFASASESLSAIERGVRDGRIYYRGMASREAIDDRVADHRYGKNKMAAEGVVGYVPHRGPLKQWFPSDLELVRGGFAHAGVRNVQELHSHGEIVGSWNRASPNAHLQDGVRIETK